MANTASNLRDQRIGSIDDVRKCPTLLVEPSKEMKNLQARLEAFLHEKVYRHYRIMRMAYKGQRIVREMFAEFCRHPDALPPRYRKRAGVEGVEQTVCDYLAGMTDRYAQDEYLRLFQPTTFV